MRWIPPSLFFQVIDGRLCVCDMQTGNVVFVVPKAYPGTIGDIIDRLESGDLPRIAGTQSPAPTLPSAQPPVWAERLLGLVLSRETEDAVLGDLHQRFNEKLRTSHSMLYAKVWYWRHAIASALDFLLALARGLYEAWRMGTGF